MSDPNVTDTTNTETPPAETTQTLGVNTTAPVAATPEAPALNPSEGTQDASAAGLAPTNEATQQPSTPDTTTTVALSGATAAGDAGDLASVATAAAAGLPSDRTIPGGVFAAAMAELDNLEQTALFWGGETGVKMRNMVCRARGLLTGDIGV